MKKIQLAIAEPCHQNWNDMTPEQKGRFCGSCQKTVVDFSTMSDRQVAEFFKKPAGSVCGRFHQDQLNRQLEVPRKRIPWVKYFFQYTWPAWMLALKSCTNSEASLGEVAVEKVVSTSRDSIPPPPEVTMGMVVSDFKEVDSVKKSEEIINVEPNHIVGLVAPSDNYVKGDTVIVERPIEDSADLTVDVKKPMEEVVIVGYPTTSKCSYLTGAVSVVTSKTFNEKAITDSDLNKPASLLKAYPNPVKTGEQLTIALENVPSQPERVQLISSTGAFVSIIQNSLAKGGRSITLSLPSTVTPGTYFLQVSMQDKTSKTAKIIVVN